MEGSNEKLAFLNVYAACQSSKSNSYLQWNEDLFSLLTDETLVLKSQGFSILALGDFNTRVGQIPGMENNTPDVNKNYPMFISFLQSTNLVIMNSLPIAKGLFTRFADTSNKPGTKSVLDYGLCDSDSIHKISSFVVDSEARFDCGSDHALLEVTISFGAKISVQWQVREALQFNFNAQSCFDGYQNELENTCCKIPLTSFSSLSTEEMLIHLVDSVRESGMKTFGIKIKKIRKGRQLPASIRDMIQTKNYLCRKLQEAYISNQPGLEKLNRKVESMKREIKTEITKMQIKRRNKLRTKLLKNDPSRKKFWAFVKNKVKASGNITGVYNIRMGNTS